MIDLVAARPDVDPARIFMTGFSNGGMMTYRFLCSAAASRLAAAASVSGTDVAGCDPSRSLPFEHIHGTGDQVVPYRGGNSLAGLILGVSFPSVTDSVAKFAAADGCHGSPANSSVGGVAYEDWSGCGNGSRVRLATLAGWGHDWPGGGSFSATDELLTFFGISR